MSTTLLHLSEMNLRYLCVKETFASVLNVTHVIFCCVFLLLQDIGSVAQQSPGLRPGSFRFSTGDGHFFHRQRVSGGRAYLRCVLSRSHLPCPVRAMMNADGSNFGVTAGVHNHGPDPLHDRVQQLRNSLLDACHARPNVRVDILYHEVCRK